MQVIAVSRLEMERMNGGEREMPDVGGAAAAFSCQLLLRNVGSIRNTDRSLVVTERRSVCSRNAERQSRIPRLRSRLSDLE